jgi:hypothetical protein
MTLVWLLCVSLVLGGFLLRSEVRAIINDWKFRLFGVPLRIVQPRRWPVPVPATPPPLHRHLSPPRVLTRPRP